jgi:hypothetical protein
MDMRKWLVTAVLALVSCVHEEEGTPLIRVVPGAAARSLWYEMPNSRLPPSGQPAPVVQKTLATEHPVD